MATKAQLKKTIAIMTVAIILEIVLLALIIIESEGRFLIRYGIISIAIILLQIIYTFFLDEMSKKAK